MPMVFVYTGWNGCIRFQCKIMNWWLITQRFEWSQLLTKGPSVLTFWEGVSCSLMDNTRRKGRVWCTAQGNLTSRIYVNNPFKKENEVFSGILTLVHHFLSRLVQCQHSHWYIHVYSVQVVIEDFALFIRVDCYQHCWLCLITIVPVCTLQLIKKTKVMRGCPILFLPNNVVSLP